MKKAYVFMGMLLGVSFILNNYTLGLASGFFDLVALFSLRPKHFVLYNLVSMPLAIVNYLNYSAFYGVLFSSAKYLPITLTDMVFGYQWAAPLVFAGLWGFTLYSSYRAFWEIKTAHNVSKWLKIKQKIYALKPKAPRPQNRILAKLMTRKILIMRSLLIGNCVLLTGAMIFLTYLVWTLFPAYHATWELLKNCDFRWTGHSFTSNLVPMIRHGIYYRDSLMICTTNLPK